MFLLPERIRLCHRLCRSGLYYLECDFTAVPGKASRKRYSDSDTIYRSPCNSAVLNLVIVCGAIVYLTVILDVFGWLPAFK